jgi:hypothetical protein
MVVVSAIGACCIGCSTPDSARKAIADTAAAKPTTMAGAPPGAATCPATGLWAECSVLYRLDRAGLVPHPDSSAKPEETSLRGKALVVKLGMNSRLEIFLYSDSASRIADEVKLNRSKFVNATAPQTINRERTLIENANLVGLLTSINDRMRERVSDALTAGAPQPPPK